MYGADRNKGGVHTPDVRWRVTTPSGMTFACVVDVHDGHVDVRLMTTSNELVCARRVPSVDAATVVVRRWLQVVLANEVSESTLPSRMDVPH